MSETGKTTPTFEPVSVSTVELANIRERHIKHDRHFFSTSRCAYCNAKPTTRDGCTNVRCEECGGAWPCPTVRLLDAYDRLRALEQENERLRTANTILDNALSTLRDHLPIAVGDADFAETSQEQADTALLAARTVTESLTVDEPLRAPQGSGVEVRQAIHRAIEATLVEVDKQFSRGIPRAAQCIDYAQITENTLRVEQRGEPASAAVIHIAAKPRGLMQTCARCAYVLSDFRNVHFAGGGGPGYWTAGDHIAVQEEQGYRNASVTKDAVTCVAPNTPRRDATAPVDFNVPLDAAHQRRERAQEAAVENARALSSTLPRGEAASLRDMHDHSGPIIVNTPRRDATEDEG